jgi:DNA-binding transcriptional LysR family regulator
MGNTLMDRFEAMRLFVRVVERRSFTAAAHDTGVPRSTVTQVVKRLEERLGAILLQRTTRTVKPTLDGEVYYRRCLAILDDVEDADGAFKGLRPKGLLRIEVQGTIARHFLLPGLPAFFSEYPDIEISMSESDRYVDLVQEGVDCVLRYGSLPDSGMIARRVALLDRVTCAAPDYIERFGIPGDLDALMTHQMVGLRLTSSGALVPLEFRVGETTRNLVLPSRIVVTGPESFLASVRLGLGLAQVPRFHIENDLAEGRLVGMLADYPAPSVPVSLLYLRNRQVSPRVRIFLDWAAREFARHARRDED